MPKKAVIQRIIESFSKDSNIVLDEKENIYRERLLYIMEEKLNNLMIQDIQLYRLVQKKYQFISFPQVCNDISIIERMIASEKDPNGDAKKTWTRYFIVENAKLAYQVAAGKGDAYTMGFLLNIIGKHNLTDKEDVIAPPFEDIIPFYPEITSDPTVLGIKPMKNLQELKDKLRKKYGIDNKILDVEIIKEDEQD